MKDLKTILFPTDFNEEAERAYEYALEIAKRSGADLHLLHVVEEPYDFATRVEEIVEAKTAEATKKFENMLASVEESEDYAVLNVVSHVERGKPYSVINEKAQQLKADLMLMGTKGESSIKRILYGNVTSDVILDTKVPVLTVPINSKKPYLDRFLFATDYRDKDMEALAATVGLAKIFDAEIHILHVAENGTLDSEIRFRGFKDLVKEKFDYGKIMFKLIEAERFSKGVSEFLDEYPVSLIVITRYKKVFLKTMLWANNTQELTYHTHVPMLVLVPESLSTKKIAG